MTTNTVVQLTRHSCSAAFKVYPLTREKLLSCIYKCIIYGLIIKRTYDAIVSLINVKDTLYITSVSYYMLKCTTEEEDKR